MNPIESQWFFRLVEEEAHTPQDRLLAVFRVMEKWISAPGIRESVARHYENATPNLFGGSELKHFLARQAMQAGAEKPDILANHLIILLQGAIMQELRSPEAHALAEARNAALAVVTQSRAHLYRRKKVLFSAGGLAATIVAAVMSWHWILPATSPMLQHQPVAMATGKSPLLPTGVSPTEMETVLALHEQFERGICPAPHLLALPPGQMTAYMNAINFRTPENPEADRENLRAFITWFKNTQSSECYIAPKNGHTNVAWTKG